VCPKARLFPFLWRRSGLLDGWRCRHLTFEITFLKSGFAAMKVGWIELLDNYLFFPFFDFIKAAHAEFSFEIKDSTLSTKKVKASTPS
jgi:hypothetical protein